MADRKTNIASFSVDGTRYDIDTFDIDGLEWRDAKRASGLSQTEIWQGALIHQDLECIGVLVWVWRRRNEPGLKLEEVLKGISFGTLIEDAEDDPNPPD